MNFGWRGQEFEVGGSKHDHGGGGVSIDPPGSF